MENSVTKAHDLLLENRRLKMREISEVVGISNDYVGYNLYEIFG